MSAHLDLQDDDAVHQVASQASPSGECLYLPLLPAGKTPGIARVVDVNEGLTSVNSVAIFVRVCMVVQALDLHVWTYGPLLATKCSMPAAEACHQNAAQYCLQALGYTA